MVRKTSTDTLFCVDAIQQSQSISSLRKPIKTEYLQAITLHWKATS